MMDTNNEYKMFIDDERFPPDNCHDTYIIARSFADVKILIENLGCPSCISFDHDLGDKTESGYDIAHWLVEMDLDSGYTFLPENFSFKVHSMNPVGSTNIERLLTNYLQRRKYNGTT